MLEEVLDYRNVHKALRQVVSNQGAAGIDGMQTGELAAYLRSNWPVLKQSVLQGSYHPSPVRQVDIPKPQGGTRQLGIPTVVDRLLQQALAQWLSPKYEPEFSAHSYGFRPGRSAQQAVLQAQTYLNEGKDWVIELDLEKFFDRVNHDKLMGLLAKRIQDKGTLRLIRRYLTSGVMHGGMVSQRLEGTPQGSPLSPLLSNIMLHELDKELEQRGHSFVRYADDCSIYVGSEQSANRVLSSVTGYIEGKLKLKVNKDKTTISRPYQSELLGFSFYRSLKRWNIRVSPDSVQRIRDKLRAKTRRRDPAAAKEKIQKIEALARGWVNYYCIVQAGSVMGKLDDLVRTRLRMWLWRQWKSAGGRAANLVKLGVSKIKAWRWSQSSLGCCRLAYSPILCTTLDNGYFQKMGYVGFGKHYYNKTGHQKRLF